MTQKYVFMYTLAAVFIAALQATTLSEPMIKYLNPQGIEFRVKDIPGTSLVGIHFSINKVIRGIKPGDINVDVTRNTDGEWVYKNNNIEVKPGDTVHYWIYRVVNGLGYHLLDKTWTAPDKLELILEDYFDTLDLNVWSQEVTASGGGNWEFQIYSEDPDNTYVRDNTLFIKPTLTADRFGEDFVQNGVLNMTEIFGKCTQSDFFGCERSGFINPIMSGKLVSKLSFRYGRAEFMTKMPRGDWIWPAIWFLPQNWEYGIWPRSGEIDLVEVRGNRNLSDIGIQTMSSTLHWGPVWNNNGFEKTTQHHKAPPKWTYADGFHKYVLDWDSTHIRTYVDDELVLDVVTPPEGYWTFGSFEGDDIWAHGGTDAPFDKEFYLILNVAVGGTGGYFPDTPGKPWTNAHAQASKLFWEAKAEWYPTWIGEDAAMQIKSVKIWKKVV